MTVSEMIEKLQEILQQEGDIVVHKTYYDEYGLTDDEVYEVTSYRSGKDNTCKVFI